MMANPGHREGQGVLDGKEVDNQVAAPAVNENAQLAPSESKSLLQECGWKDGVSGDSAGEKNLVQRKNNRAHLTPTGLLMEGNFRPSHAETESSIFIFVLSQTHNYCDFGESLTGCE
jgi:hypothetical protein